MPRVVTGKYRGAVLFAPKGDTTRPTTDKVKESLFSILQNRIPDCSFLDLFAGCGQIGIEAVSRGAARAVLVDKGGEQISVIRRNLEKIHASGDDSIKVMRAPYDKALSELIVKGEKFDIIYMDPPYRMAEEACIKVCEILSANDLLSEDGMLLVEHASDLPFDEEKMGLTAVRSCSYGLTVITFFMKRSNGGT